VYGSTLDAAVVSVRSQELKAFLLAILKTVQTRGSSLQALWPTLAAVEHRDDLQTLAAAESIRNDVPCAWHHQLTSPRYPPGAPDIWQLRQAIDRSE
jgi:hypothetical protein